MLTERGTKKKKERKSSQSNLRKDLSRYTRKLLRGEKEPNFQ